MTQLNTLSGSRKKVMQINKDIETLLGLITRGHFEAVLGRLVRLGHEKRESEFELKSLEMMSKTQRLSDDEICHSFDMARLLLRNGKLSNL